jgi:hypothetical protein
MPIAAALIVGGSIVYAFVPTDAGAWMIAAGCALAVTAWVAKATAHWFTTTKAG